MIKDVVFRMLLKRTAKKNILYMYPMPICVPETMFVGFKIRTSLKNNKQKDDIPPFYHDVYDGHRLDALKRSKDLKMFCIFDLKENKEDLDYYIAVEHDFLAINSEFAQFQLSTGAYLKIEFLKRNNKTVSMIMLYMRLFWMKANGFAERKAPSFIVYDERFHSNYQEYGCRKGEYLGTPIATLYLPV